MAGALLYLFVRTATNRLRVRLRRLREPRYLIGSVAGLTYLYFFAFRHVFSRPGRMDFTPLAALERLSQGLELAGAVALFAILAAAWLVPGLAHPIEFTRPEVQFLFQAPVSRRQLLHYKILRGQVGPLLGTAIATIFLRPASVARGWMFLASMWMVLALVRLHLTGVALRRQSLAEHGARGFRRQWLPVALVGLAMIVLVGTVALRWPTLAEAQTAPEVFRELQRLATTGPAGWVLWPFRWLARLPLAATPDAFLRALPPTLGLLALNYLWVLRGDVAFEEASAAYAEQRAIERRGASSAGRRVKVAPFRLAPAGGPEAAILWKNLILMGRYASPRVFLRVIAAAVVLVVAFARLGSSPGIASSIVAVAVATLVLTVVLGPQIVRNDLRQDLASLAMLKTWPVSGSALVRGELLAPAFVLTGVAWFLILVVAVFVRVHGRAAFGAPPEVVSGVVPIAIGAGLVAPALVLAQLVLHNGLAILFPAWVALGASRARGIDAMGQRLLMMAGVVLVLVLSLVPAAAAAGLSASLLWMVAPRAGALLVLGPSLVGTLVLLAECWIAVEALGRLFDRTDVASIDAVE